MVNTTKMRNFRFFMCIFLVFLLIPTAVSASDWDRFQKDNYNSGVTSDKAPITNPVGNGISWEKSYSFGGWSGFNTAPVVVGDLVYVVGADNKVRSLYKINGTEKWEASTSGSGFLLANMAAGNGSIFVPTRDGKIFAIDQDTGIVQWSATVTSGQLNTPVVYDDHKVYFGEWYGNNKYYCYSDDGTKLWDRTSTSGSGYYWAGAAIIGDYLIYGDDKGYLTSVYKANGTTVDSLNVSAEFGVTSNEIRSSINYVEDLGRIYFTSKGGYIYVLGMNADGTFDTSDKHHAYVGYSTSTPAVYNGKVYVGAGGMYGGGNGLSCLDEDLNGEWDFVAAAGQVQSSPAITTAYDEGDGEVYIYFTTNAAAGKVYCVNESGVEQWSWGQSGKTDYTLCGVAISDGWIFYGTDNKYVFGFATSESLAPVVDLPVADLTANVTKGNAPLAVQFTDLSTNGPTSWAWDFDNDGVVDSTEQNPSHVYSAAGVYTAKLTATNSAGSDIMIKMEYIYVESPASDFIYTSSGSVITITGYVGPGGNVIIPSNINGLPVTSIGELAFTSKATITTVIIPDSVTSIGYAAFNECTSLTSVTIPDSVNSIGTHAFRDCTSLTSVIIPDGVTSIGHLTFRGCTSLTSVTIPDSVTSIGQDAFRSTALTSVIIPDRVTSIGHSAFRFCTPLTSIVFMGNAPTVGEHWAEGCTNLIVHYQLGATGFTTPTWMGVPCYPLTDLPVAQFSTDPVSGIAPLVVQFTDLSVNNPTSWTWDFDNDGVVDSTEQNPSHVYSAAGTYTVTLTASNSVGSTTNTAYVVVHEGTSPTSDFSYYSMGGVITIYGYEGPGGNVVIPSTIEGLPVTTIAANTFQSQNTINSVTIPDSVTSIGNEAFRSCSLSSVNIPYGVTNIGHSVFWGSGLTSVTIPDSVTHIGHSAFRLSPLTSVTIGSGLTSIGGEAFRDCTALTSVTIPNSVTSIGNYAFLGCTSLTSVTIPDSVTSIGSSAFTGCTALASMVFNGNAPTVGDHWARYCDNLVVYYQSEATGFTTPTWQGFPCYPLVSVPVADFGASVTSGDAPLTVQFTDLSTNNPTSWEWDFDNDGVVDSTEQNPSHVYSASGTYTVKLMVGNSAGSDDKVKSDYIAVGSLGPTVLWTGTVELPAGGTFDFVDMNGNPYTGLSIETDMGALYSTGLSFQAELGWIESIGGIDNEPWGPDAYSWAIYKNGIPCYEGLYYNPVVTGDNIKLYYTKWDPNIFIPLLDEPLYLVDINIVVIDAPMADFEASVTSGDAPLTVQFTDLSTNNPTSWEWDFDNDGVVDSTEQNPSHVYSAPGTYTVKLTVGNSAGSDDKVKSDYIAVSETTSSPTWKVFHGNQQLTGYYDGLTPNTNAIKWISGYIDTQPSSSVVIGEGKVFVHSFNDVSMKSYIAALDVETGDLIWKRQCLISNPYGSWATPAYQDGLVFTPGDGARYASNGTLLWIGLPDNTNGGPMVAEGKVFIGNWDGGKYFAFDEKTGQQIWSFTVSGYAQGTPAYHNGKLFLTSWYYEESPAGYLYCVNADTGVLLWTTYSDSSDQQFCGSPCIAAGYVYVTSYNFYGEGAIYCFLESDGSLVWQQTIQRTDSTPAYHDGKVYVTGGCYGYSDRQTYCFDAVTGTLIWSTTPEQEIGGWTTSVVISADGKVFVGRESAWGGMRFGYDKLFALDAATGAEVWSYNGCGSTVAISDGVVYSAGIDGRIYAFSGGPAPMADFEASMTSGDAPLTVQFTDQSTNGPTSWAWDFNNDGVVDSTEQNPQFTYTDVGTYTVSLIVSNSAGSDTETKVDYLVVESSGDWNPWNDPDSDGGEYITFAEVMEAYGCFTDQTGAPGTGAEIDFAIVMEMYNAFANQTPM